MSPRITNEQIVQMQELRNEGMSCQKIANAINVSKNSVCYHLNSGYAERRKLYSSEYYKNHVDELRQSSIEYRKNHVEEKRQYDIKYRRNHVEEKRQYSIKYHKNHADRKRKYNAIYSKCHVDKLRQYSVEYYKNNINKLRQYGAEYYKDHINEKRQYDIEYYKSHADEIRKCKAEYRKNHPAEIAARSAMRRAQKRNAFVNLTPAEKTQIKELYRQARKDLVVKCYLCGKRIPLGHRHVDHIMPLSKGGKHHFCNLAIVCDSCNQSKYTKLPSEVGLLL